MPKKELKRGAPVKKKRLRSNGLRDDQWERLEAEAEARGESIAAVHRRAVDWFFTALDTKRGNVNASALFDNEGGDVQSQA